MSIDQTALPSHLSQMLRILVMEAEAESFGGDAGGTGPCLEYTLQHKILETLYTLARTDVSVE